MEDLTHMMEESFYAKKLYFSYSSLKKLMYSPGSFYNHYVLLQREDRMDNHLVQGKVIHCLILEEDHFNNYFVVSPTKLPEGNNKLIVEKMFSLYTSESNKQSLEDYQTDIIEYLVQINLHQSLKTDDQRLDKVVVEQNISYFDFLKKKGDKNIVDAETLEYCLRSKELLQSNKQIAELLGIGREQTDTFKVYNEMSLQMELDKAFSFGLKGIIDNIVVDADNKRIYINDLKTTNRSIVDFKDTVEVFSYWMQAAVYLRLVLDFFKEFINDSWVIKFNFIVIDNSQQVYAFEVSKSTMLEWLGRLNHSLRQGLYHYENRDYNLPYDFARGKVYL